MVVGSEPLLVFLCATVRTSSLHAFDSENTMQLGVQSWPLVFTIGTLPSTTPNLWQLCRYYGSGRCGKGCLNINFPSDTNQVNCGHRKYIAVTSSNSSKASLLGFLHSIHTHGTLLYFLDCLLIFWSCHWVTYSSAGSFLFLPQGPIAQPRLSLTNSLKAVVHVFLSYISLFLKHKF